VALTRCREELYNKRGKDEKKKKDKGEGKKE